MHDEARLQIYVVNRAFKEVAGISYYLMSSLNSHRHFKFWVVWFERTYHLSLYLSRDLICCSICCQFEESIMRTWHTVFLQFRAPYNNLTQLTLAGWRNCSPKGKCFTIIEEWCRKSCFEHGTKKWRLSFRWSTRPCRTHQSTWSWLGNQVNWMKLFFLKQRHPALIRNPTMIEFLLR